MVVVNEERSADQNLLDMCKQGEADAFDALVTKYLDPVYTLVYRLIGDADECAHLVRETFERAYAGVEQAPENMQVHIWLYSIATNQARNILRESSATIGEVDAGSTDPQVLLGMLPEHPRVVFVLSTFLQLPYGEIAEIAGCSRSAVKSRMSQARTLLRDALRAQTVAS